MLKHSLYRSCPPALVVEASDHLHGANPNLPKKPVSTSIPSYSRRGKDSIPKLEPFSISKLEQVLRDRPLIEKTRNEIADYCSRLEGDTCYSCWSAYLELRDLEEKLPKRDVEEMIIDSKGMTALIVYIHRMSSMIKGISSVPKEEKSAVGLATPKAVEEEKERLCPIPDGLPKSQEEIEEEEKGRLPDSPFTRLLRTVGRSTAQYRMRNELSWL